MKYAIANLPNGLYRIECRQSLLSGCYKNDGSYVHGDLCINIEIAKRLINNSGFTLIEMLVVIIMVGILSAIAVPSWLSFTERQKLLTSADLVLQAVNAAQSTAKRTKNTVVLATPITPSDKSVVITPPATPLTFDYAGTTKEVPYKIDLTITGSTNNRYCVVVRSLLGITSIGKNTTECAALIAS